MPLHNAPPGTVTLRAIVGLKAVDKVAAEANRRRQQALARLAPRERLSASLKLEPIEARRPALGLAPGLSPHDVRAAVRAGRLPPPIKGPWGEAWPVESVIAWAEARR